MPLVIGHRGASRRFPENTLAAFRAALADGADGIELDVRLSRDGRAIVIHDATLRRTAGVAARVTDLSAAELARFDVPTLRAVLELTAPSAVVYVEIKGGGSALEASVVDEIRRARAHARVVVLSFNHSSLRRVRTLDANVATSASVAPTLRVPKPSPARLIELASRASSSSLALHHSLATRRVVGALADRGIGVLAWTVNRIGIARRVANAGVAAVMTDEPARLARAWGRS